MTFLDIWNEAYNLYTDGRKSESRCYNDTQRFLEERVKAGDITVADKAQIFTDIRETAGL